MNTLTVDIGNNKIKPEFWSDEGFLYGYECENLSISELKKEIDIRGTEGIIVSSVRKDTKDLIKQIREESGCEIVIEFNSEEIKKYKDKIKYKGNIGTDRIAAFVGAESLLPGVPKLIVDSGTAITLDVADGCGNFCGGNISLGLYSRMKTLWAATSLLPDVKDLQETPPFGDSTVTAIQSGAINGVTGEILFSIELAKRDYKIERVVITGGDSGKFIDRIEALYKNCIVDPHLVGRGLNYHLRKYYFSEIFPDTKFIPSI